MKTQQCVPLFMTFEHLENPGVLYCLLTTCPIVPRKQNWKVYLCLYYLILKYRQHLVCNIKMRIVSTRIPAENTQEFYQLCFIIITINF